MNEELTEELSKTNIKLRQTNIDLREANIRYEALAQEHAARGAPGGSKRVSCKSFLLKRLIN